MTRVIACEHFRAAFARTPDSWVSDSPDDHDTSTAPWPNDAGAMQEGPIHLKQPTLELLSPAPLGPRSKARLAADRHLESSQT